MPTKKMSFENCGPDFNLELFLKARELAIQAVQLTAQKIRPKTSELEAIDILNIELKTLGVEKFWHPTKFRLGINTIKSFRDISEPTLLGEDDIFFIDIGPVFFNHESDYGETFVIGNNPKYHALAKAAKDIFNLTQVKWREQKLSGIELYEYAQQVAIKQNFKLNTKMYGHRLGDFPHALHFNGKLGDINISPAPDLWVLEIHIIDEDINRGAFFEDILR